MRIALVQGFWGQNLGNSFFNLGGRALLRRAFPEAQQFLIGDLAGYRTFNNQQQGSPKAALDLAPLVDVDLLVLQGPLLTVAAESLWGETIRGLRQRGVATLLLGVGLFKYTIDEVQAARRFVANSGILGVVTRDRRTYRALSAHSDVAVIDGIDSAFALPSEFQPPALIAPPAVVLNFDRRPEPRFIEREGQEGPRDLDWDGRRYSVEFPRIASRLSAHSKALAYVGQLINRHEGAQVLFGREVWRTEHRTNPWMGQKVYQRKRVLAMDEPWSYLAAYAHADLTITDRVHAAVVALSYGRAVVPYIKSPRASLLERVGIDIAARPQYLSQDRRISEVAHVVQSIQKLPV